MNASISSSKTRLRWSKTIDGAQPGKIWVSGVVWHLGAVTGTTVTRQLLPELNLLAQRSSDQNFIRKSQYYSKLQSCEMVKTLESSIHRYGYGKPLKPKAAIRPAWGD